MSHDVEAKDPKIPWDQVYTRVVKIAEDNAASGKIEPLQNLSNSPVYIWSGKDDPTVRHENQVLQERFYNNYQANVKLVTADAGHTITDSAPKDIE